MKIPYAILENIIYIEVLLVFIILISTFVLKFLYQVQAGNNNKMSTKIELYFVDNLMSKRPFSEKEFLKPWRRLDLVLPIIHKVSQHLKSPGWNQFKQEISESILLPIARKKYKSHNWVHRLFAAKCFELAMNEQDEKHLSALLIDKVPLVHMHAVVAAVKHCNETFMNIIINTMSEKRRLGQAIYIKIFETAPPNIHVFVEARLKNEQNLFTRATCYKILQTLPITELEPTVEMVPDIRSPNLELRLSVIRFIASALHEKSISILISLLTDEQWQIRVACVRILGSFQQSTVIPELTKCLSDPVYLVRFNATKAIQNIEAARLSESISRNSEVNYSQN